VAAHHEAAAWKETRLGRVLVVNANVRKSFRAVDRCDARGSWNFVRLLHEQLGTKVPDVLLLQEVTNGTGDAADPGAPAACGSPGTLGVVDRIVDQLNARYYGGMPAYEKVVWPTNSNYDRCNDGNVPDDPQCGNDPPGGGGEIEQVERETAIVINGLTMEKSQSAGSSEQYLRTTYSAEQASDEPIASRDHAAACLQEKVRPGDPSSIDPITLPVTSIHFVEQNKLKLSIHRRKAAAWSNQARNYLQDLCGPGRNAFVDDTPDAWIVAGDVNNRRCKNNGPEAVWCGSKSAFAWWSKWRRNGFTDAAWADNKTNEDLVNQVTHGNTGAVADNPGAGSRIDYIFSRATVCAASAHLQYHPKDAPTASEYSDHRFVFALVERRSAPAC
jgi:endonuclease/exonuclease/phosphatase family metal-dependent hydrolase